jgi:hypothetical protein
MANLTFETLAQKKTTQGQINVVANKLFPSEQFTLFNFWGGGVPNLGKVEVAFVQGQIYFINRIKTNQFQILVF